MSESGLSGAAASASSKAGPRSVSRSLQKRQRLQDEENNSTEVKVPSEQEAANAPSTNNQAQNQDPGRSSRGAPMSRRRTVNEAMDRGPQVNAAFKAKKHPTMKDSQPNTFLLPPARGRTGNNGN